MDLTFASSEEISSQFHLRNRSGRAQALACVGTFDK